MISKLFLLTKQLLIKFRFLIVMVKSGLTVWSQLFGIVFTDTEKYNVMYLPWVVIHQKDFLSYIMGNRP